MAFHERFADQELDLYRTHAEKSLDIMFFFRAGDGRIVSANPSAMKMYGYGPNEILTKTIRQIRAPHTVGEIDEQIARARNESFRFETVHVRKDGSEFPVEATWSYSESSGEPLILTVARDITERHRIDQALRESELELADFFENAAVGLHWVGPDGTILRANAAELEMLGYEREEYIGKNIADFHVDESAINDILTRLTSGEKIEHYSARLRARDGSIKHVLITSSAWFRDGQFKHTRCFTTDITEKKLFEAERADALVKENEARREAETLNELARTVAAELDLKALTQRVTDVATELTGAAFGAFFYNVLDEQGESFLLYTLSGISKEAFRGFGMPRNTPIFGPTFRGERVVRIDDVTSDPRYGQMAPHHGMPPGHPSVRSYMAAPVTSRSGETIGGLFFGHPVAGVFRESDERMVVGLAAHAAVAVDNARLYEDLLEARNQLESKVLERTSQLSKMASELMQEVKERTAAEAQIRQILARLVNIQEEERHRIARNIHDDLGQHLTAIRINLRALVAGCSEQDELREQAEMVERLAQEVDSSIDSITWELRPADLEELGLVKALENLVSSWSRRFNLPAEFSVIGKPPADVPTETAVHLYRITQEALHNIYKHARGTQAGVIFKSEKEGFSLIIEDDGVGFSQNVLKDSSKHTNSSLGLVSMRERATLIQASLEIESSPNKGTTVFVRAPFVK